jgi:hypothetical protein
MVDLFLSRLTFDYYRTTTLVTNKRQGASLIIGSIFMLISRRLLDKDLGKKW